MKNQLFEEEEEIQDFEAQQTVKDIKKDSCDLFIYLLKSFTIILIITVVLFVFCWIIKIAISNESTSFPN